MDRPTPRRLLLLFQRFHDPIWTQQPLHSACREQTSPYSIPPPRLGNCKNPILPCKASPIMRLIYPQVKRSLSVFQVFISHGIFPDSESRPVWLSWGQGMTENCQSCNGHRAVVNHKPLLPSSSSAMTEKGHTCPPKHQLPSPTHCFLS